MKNNYFFIAGLVAGSMAFNANAQDATRLAADGTVEFVKLDTKGANFRSGAQDVEKIFQKYLYATPSDQMRKVASQQDEMGYTHDRYQQYYKGIKVEFGSYIVHAKGGVIESINGAFKNMTKADLSMNISEEVALNAAIKHVGAQTYQWQVEGAALPKGEKVIVDGQLAYKFDIYAEQPVSRADVYVSAKDGSVVFENKTIKHAVNGTAATRYSGTRTIQTGTATGGYNLRDNSRGLGVETYDMNTGTNYSSAVDFVDADNNWTSAEWNNTAKDNAAFDAHWGAQMTYDYWMSVHNRSSYDGAGAKIKSYVHYSRAYDNAFWNGSVMTYGDGSGTNFDALTSLDVAAHEIGHAVCEKTANLVYSNESGAMNEGFSDIWAACVEAFAAPEKSIWLIGEDIERRAGHAALRSMSDPNSEGQPDTYQGTMWYTGTGDNGGVHYNSGVLNHWFYRLTVGGSGTNDKGTAFNVAGIGITKAAKIAFRLESVYLTSQSNYQAAANYGAQAAADLFGAGSAEYAATVEAFKAVGLVVAGTGGGGGGTTTPTCGTATNTSASRRTWKYYTVTIPAGTTSWTAKTTGSNGDADLYVRYNAQPTTSTYAARSAGASSNESVTVSNPTAGTWYIGVYAYAAYSGLTVESCTSGGTALAGNAEEATFDAAGEEIFETSIYPNPASSELNITMAEGETSVAVVSLTGQVLMKVENTEKGIQTLNIAHLNKGMYLVVIEDEKGQSVHKFMKQ